MKNVDIALELLKVAKSLIGKLNYLPEHVFEYNGNTVVFLQGFQSKPWAIIKGPALNGKKIIKFKTKRLMESYIDS